MTAGILLLAAACSDPTEPGKDDHSTDTGASTTADTHDTRADTASDSDTSDGTGAVVCDRRLSWSYVAAGLRQTCGVHVDGCAECWGAGEDDIGPSYEWEGEDRPPDGEYASIHMMRYSEWDFGQQNCGILADGSPLCFGDNEFGEGDLPPGDYVDIGTATYFTVGVTVDGNINWAGMVDAVPPTGPFTRVEVDDDYIVLLRRDGSLATYRWPSGLVDDRPGPYIAMSRGASPDGICAVTEAGAVECWMDDGRTEPVYDNFAALAPTAGMTDVCFAPADLEACALAGDGHIECWSPATGGWFLQGVPAGSEFVRLACGGAHLCALTSSGEITCWGYDVYGETIPPT